MCVAVFPSGRELPAATSKSSLWPGVEQNSPLLIAAEPTRGLDIGAMEFIHNKLLEKRQKGDGVLLISSELTEILTLSDRIYVIYNGKAVGEFTRANATEERLGILMMGGALDEAAI